MSAVLNISISLLMVRVFNLGVAGLAIAANISAIAATVCYVYLLRRAFQEMSSEKVSYRFHFSCVRNSLKYSIPFAIQQLVFHGVSFVISPSINALGAATTTGYNVSQRIYLFGTQSLWATTAAFARYTGQCVGEGNVQKIRSGVRKGFRLVVTIVFPFVFFLMIFAKPVISLFFPQSYSGDSFYYALRYATIYLPFVYIQLIGDFFHNYMRSLGRVNVVLGITVVGSATNIACTLLLIPYFHLEGVFIGQIISWTIDMILSFILYFYRYRTEEHLTNVLQHTV